jgi:chromosome segregation ATPase
VKEMLENEISSHNIQKEILQTDLNSLSSEHEALKAAYHALSYESATQQTKLNSTQHHSKDLEEYKEKVKKLETDLQLIRMQSVQNESLTKQIEALEEQMRVLNLENVKLTSSVNASKEEVQQYKKLIESYKNKIKELSASQNKENNFFDSFEEVMQEEMMTMKAAFEAKLRAARDEVDSLSKKHQQEINKLQTKSPYSFFNNNPASSTSMSSK